MTHILLGGLEPQIRIVLETEFSDLGNTIHMSDHTTLVEKYEQVTPDLVLMDYSDMDESLHYTRQIVEFDHTACIFAMVTEPTTLERDRMYKRGVRVILEQPDLNNLDDFVNQLFSACNDLEHENCIGCWKTNRFENLSSLT